MFLNVVEKREFFFFVIFFYEGEEEEEDNVLIIESVFFWHVFSTTYAHTRTLAKKKIHARF